MLCAVDRCKKNLVFLQACLNAVAQERGIKSLVYAGPALVLDTHIKCNEVRAA
jgi:hypothetical protein